MSELDLKFAFLGTGMFRKDIENKAGAVDDLHIERLFQVLVLARRELIIENDDAGAFGMHLIVDLLNLPFTDICRRIRTFAVLNHFTDDSRAGRDGQLAKFIERL